VLVETKGKTDLEESKVLVEVDLTRDDSFSITGRHSCHVYLIVEEIHHCILLSHNIGQLQQ